MPSRRSHSKSHHGCTQCKRRQIKCDESFAPQTSPHRSIADIPLDRPGSSVLPLLDLELLHHWHTVTAKYLADAKPLQDVIRTAMPQEGLANPFLMHSVLAVSALHRAQTVPLSHCQLYAEAAMTHHSRSLALCTPLFNNITRQNCHALFALSCLVPVFVFASQSPRKTSRVQNLSEVVEAFRLIRGMASVVDQARSWIEEGPLHPLLRDGQFQKPIPTAAERYTLALYTQLQSLALNQPQAGPSLNSGPFTPAPHGSIGNLLDLLQLYLNSGDSRAIMAWPVVVDPYYFECLLRKERIALLALAFYGSALQILSGHWWLEGWGELLLKLARDHLPGADKELVHIVNVPT
ncbi:Zn(II)2Cys6 transcription factor domain-containing protein [Aspergillus thermomutatus]|uniref:Zn(2)-C6 fungal-type domain-containing protein n=1 Tax=Aspergillus thermomutatus TaxID=41047 RepID=A0A397H286_ASPTH|nr:uncharacterized protein CDV56_105341 [Aspergillus thermomutatus]RHZ55814.1 hypothetical protein CDV56_105341 [Aspergillus thermomutatus]